MWFIMYHDCDILQQGSAKLGIFTSDSSANLMVGCSGPLTPPPTTEDGMVDTTIMPHPHAQQVHNTNCMSIGDLQGFCVIKINVLKISILRNAIL